MTGGDIKTARQARRLLKLPDTADFDAVKAAYRVAVREAHPDTGGDAETLRRVIDAYRLLTHLHEARAHLKPAPVSASPAQPRPGASAPLEISVIEALRGGQKTIRLPGGRLGRMALPAGLRVGDQVRLQGPDGAVMFKVHISRTAVEVRGNHLWMTALVDPEILEKGGRFELDSPTGFKSVWVSPDSAKSGLVRLVGQGLPPRGFHAQGHLFLKLEPDPELAVRARPRPAPGESVARTLLRRFAAAWAA